LSVVEDTSSDDEDIGNDFTNFDVKATNDVVVNDIERNSNIEADDPLDWFNQETADDQATPEDRNDHLDNGFDIVTFDEEDFGGIFSIDDMATANNALILSVSSKQVGTPSVCVGGLLELILLATLRTVRPRAFTVSLLVVRHRHSPHRPRSRATVKWSEMILLTWSGISSSVRRRQASIPLKGMDVFKIQITSLPRMQMTQR
jgi:hypothetical protein